MKRAIVVACALVACASVVRADAIAGPPACPPGAVARSSHAGQWCEPAPCASDADCSEAGGSCQEWRVCTRVFSITPGGLRPRPAPPEDTTLVVGTCAPSAACNGTEEPPPQTAGVPHDPPP